MISKSTYRILLASSAFVGVIAATPAFAQIEDAANTGVALVTTPIVNATDGNKNLLLTTLAENIQTDEAALTIGTGTGSAIQAQNNGGATTFTLDNTGAAVASTVTVKGTVDKEATQDLNFDITGAANQDFTVNLQKAVNLGAGDLTLTGSTNATSATLSGNLTAGSITSDGTAGGATTVTLNGTTTLSGGVVLTAATGNVVNNGTLTVGTTVSGAGNFTNAGTATVTGDVTATGTIANSGKLTLNGANSAATINNSGTLVIGQALTNTGTIDLASSGSTTVDLTALANGDTAITGGAIALTGNAKVLLDANLVNTDVVTLTNLDTIDAAAATQLTAAHALNQVTINTAAAGITLTVGAANTAAQTAAALGVSDLEGAKLLSAGTDAVAGNFTAAGAAFTPTENAILAALNSPSTAAAAAQQLGDATAAAGGIAAATAGAFNAASGKIGDRLASLRGGETSMAAGDSMLDQNMWFEATATHADQNARQGASGFTVKSAGGTIGYDKEINTGYRAGLAFSYNYADVDGDSAANVNNHVNTYLLSAYGEKAYGDTFANADVHFGLNDVATRQDVLGFGRMTGDYTTVQYGAGVEAGHTYTRGETRFVPTVGLRYTRINGDKVTLRQGANAVVDDISAKDLLVAKIGTRVEGDYARKSGATLRPEAHVNFLYDFMGDEVSSVRSFGGVTVADQEAKVAKGAVNAGLGMTFESADKRAALKVGYDVDYKDEYLAHTASAKLSVKF